MFFGSSHIKKYCKECGNITQIHKKSDSPYNAINIPILILSIASITLLFLELATRSK